MRIAIVKIDGSGHRHAYLLGEYGCVRERICFGIRGEGRCTAGMHPVGARLTRTGQLPVQILPPSRAPRHLREWFHV